MEDVYNADLLDAHHEQSTLSPPKYKLGFIHIPKTGGSSIERAGSNAGLNWGSCMFKPLLSTNDKNNDITITDCPTQDLLQRFAGRPVPRNVRRSLAPWHAPMKCLPNPYYKELYEELFAVVRDPYARMVSEYYFSCADFGTKKCTNEDRNDARFMNQWIQEQVGKVSAGPNSDCDMYARGHFIRQYDYIVNSKGQRAVQHLLRMEHLEADFQQLMSRSDATRHIVLLRERDKVRDNTDTLTVHDLTYDTITMIQSFYAKDFEVGNYSLTIQ
jgi:hypothetical protein